MARFWLRRRRVSQSLLAHSQTRKHWVENAGPPTVYQDLKALSWPFTQELEEYCRISKQLQGHRKRDLENEELVFFTLEILPEPDVCRDQLKS